MIHRSRIPIFLTYFLDHFGFAIVFLLFGPLILQQNSIFPLEQEGRAFIAIFSLLVFPIAQSLGAPIFGGLSDRIGRKKTFLMTIAGTVFGNFVMGLAFYHHQFFLLIAGRLVAGFCAGNLTLCLASLSDMSRNEKDKVYNFSQLAAIAGLSYIFAVLSGDVFSKFSPSTLFWITSALGTLNFFLLFLLFEETKKANPTKPFSVWRIYPFLKQFFNNPVLNSLYLCFFFFMLCFVPTLQYFPQMLEERFSFTEQTIVILLIILGSLWSISNWILSRFAIPFSQNVLFRLLLLLGFFLILAGIIPLTPFFLVSFMIAYIGAALIWTYLFVGISDHASLSTQGEVLGISQSIGTLGVLTGLFLKRFFTSFYPHQYYLLAGILILIAAFIASLFRFKKIP